MNYYIQGNKDKAGQIKAAFGKFVSTQEMAEYDFSQEEYLFYTGQEERGTFVYAAWSDSVIAEIIKTHPDYKELELPIQPKFKVGDWLVYKNGNCFAGGFSEAQVVKVEDGVYFFNTGTSGSFKFIDENCCLRKIKPHYDISNFHAGMPVLVRDDRWKKWCYALYSHYDSEEDYQFVTAGDIPFIQCIPYNDDTKHLLGTTDMCDEYYISW